LGQFKEGDKKASAEHIHDSISRRKFISGSAAVIAAVVFDGAAAAVANDVGQASSGGTPHG
jgi:secreted PhoX family phosphatase